MKRENAVNQSHPHFPEPNLFLAAASVLPESDTCFFRAQKHEHYYFINSESSVFLLTKHLLSRNIFQDVRIRAIGPESYTQPRRKGAHQS